MGGDAIQQNPMKPLPEPEPERGPGAEDNQQEEVPTLEKLSTALHTAIERFFKWLTLIVVQHPLLVIAVVVVVTAVMVQGVWFFEEETASEHLFTPQGSRAFEEEEWVVERFGHSGRRLIIYFVAGGADSNILSKKSLDYLFEMHEWVTTELKEEDITYQTVCKRYSTNDTCKEPASLLSLWGHNATRFNADANYMATINSTLAWRTANPSGPDRDFYLSEVTMRGADIVGAKAAMLIYGLKNDRVKVSGVGLTDPESRKFELSAGPGGRAKSSSDYSRTQVSAYIWSESEEEDAGNDQLDRDVSSLIIGYVVMTFYTCFILSRSRLRYSHANLGFISVASVAMATITAYGLMWYVGVKFNPVVQVLVLVLLGVGVDDAFVIMDSWWDNAETPDMKERMVKAVAHAGPAITLTSVTDMIAFLAGSSSVYPALRDFCYYAAVGVAFDFIYQVTFFVAFAYLSSRRQANSKADVMCCITVSDDTGCCTKAPRCGDADEQQEQWKESDRGMQNYVVGTAFPRILLGSSVGKGVAMLLSAFFLAIGIWGCTEVEMDFSIEWFVPDGTIMDEVLDVRDQYFPGAGLPMDVYFADMDYPRQQALIHDAEERMANDPWLTGRPTSWLSDFTTWVEGNVPTYASVNGSTVPSIDGATGHVIPEAFYPLLRQYLSRDRAGSTSADWQHIDNVRWSTDGSRVVASRINGRFVKQTLAKAQNAIDAMDSMRADIEGLVTAGQQGLGDRSPFVWTYAFLFWEGFKVMIQEVTRNVAIAGACVFVVVTLLVANLQLGLWVVVSIGCVDVCLIGYMSVLGVAFNSVSIICIVVAIGLAVDYSVHIAEAFLHAKATDTEGGPSARCKRAAYALWKMGPAVINGGTSTFIAILPLAAAKSYVFTVFFRMFCIIIFFGLFFGVVMLPVILSVVGPSPLTSAQDLDECPWMCPLNDAKQPSKPDAPMDDSHAPDSPGTSSQ